MKKLIILLIVVTGFLSCDKKTKVEKEVKSISVDVSVIRFDKIFFEASPSDLGRLKNEFPYFFPDQTPDQVWIEKMQNPLWRELYQEVQVKYADFEPIKSELAELFKHIKYYFQKQSDFLN